jgi:hypothetical protein
MKIDVKIEATVDSPEEYENLIRQIASFGRDHVPHLREGTRSIHTTLKDAACRSINGTMDVVVDK